MNWKPLGHVFKTDTYGQTPTPLVLADRVRIFYASRENGRALVEFVDLDLDDPTKIIAGPSGRALENGALGAFDGCGQMPSFAERESDGTIKLWYSGWVAPAGDAPYHNATGIAVSNDGGATFKRLHEGPVLDRTIWEPYLRVTPWKVGLRLWWISGLRWEMIDGKAEPIYVIRQGFQDGVWNGIAVEQGRWRERPALSPAFPPDRYFEPDNDECFSRPCVFERNGTWTMLYSYRKARDYRDGANAYRVGMATSESGWQWKRRDEEFKLPRTPGFDDTMQAYAATFDVNGKLFMVFNGNSFGKHGFGLAICE